MSEVTFDAWLFAQDHRDDAVGDAARDAAEDRRRGCLPDFRYPVQLLRHMIDAHDADLSAQVAVHHAWDEFNGDLSHSVVLFRNGTVFRVIGPMSRDRARRVRARMLRQAEQEGDTGFACSAIKTYPSDYVWSNR